MSEVIMRHREAFKRQIVEELEIEKKEPKGSWRILWDKWGRDYGHLHKNF